MMIEARRDDGMIEIGDMEDDSPLAPDGPPQVVIEYRDRGIPWMLVPPLLALVAVVAGVGVYNFYENQKQRRPAPAPVVVAAPPASPEVDDLPEPVPGYPLHGSRFDGPPPLAPEAQVAANPPTPTPAPVVTPAPAVSTPEPAAAPLTATGEAGSPAGAVAPSPIEPPAPRIDALGFDPKAFGNPPSIANSTSTGVPVDLNLEPVGRDAPVAEVPGAATAPDQPELVDPDLLPPDPRKARAERRQRALNAQRQAEADRATFHAQALAIYRKHKERSAPMVMELCQAYGQDVPPAAKDQAMKLLGRSGDFAGANTTQRINVLRQLGFPEPAILGDIFDLETRYHSAGARDALSKDQIFVRSLITLLGHPPNRPGGPARAAASP